MAVAPLNKFLTFAVPVAPGEQVIYSAPVGVSAIILRAQVANVGIGETYPKITVTHRRKTNRTNKIRDIRVVKNTEIPPEDALVVIDGRYVLERTALISDSIVIEGTQAGIVSIFDCKYHEPTGITTIITWQPHNFNVGDEITMSGLKFVCPNSTGITTDIFPSPQQSFTVLSIQGTVGTSLTFTTDAGTASGIAHTYVSGGVVAPLQMEFTCSILENSNA